MAKKIRNMKKKYSKKISCSFDFLKELLTASSPEELADALLQLDDRKQKQVLIYIQLCNFTL